MSMVLEFLGEAFIEGWQLLVEIVHRRFGWVAAVAVVLVPLLIVAAVVAWLVWG